MIFNSFLFFFKVKFYFKRKIHLFIRQHFYYLMKKVNKQLYILGNWTNFYLVYQFVLQLKACIRDNLYLPPCISWSIAQNIQRLRDDLFLLHGNFLEFNTGFESLCVHLVIQITPKEEMQRLKSKLWNLHLNQSWN